MTSSVLLVMLTGNVDR